MENLEQISINSQIVSASLLFILLLWETVLPFFLLLAGKKRAIHGAKNLLLGAINALMLNMLFVSLWFYAAKLSVVKEFGLFYYLPSFSWLEAAFAVLFFDFFTYWWHRLSHEIPFLWRFHRVHHSDAQMDVSTAYRFHFGEIFISSILRAVIILLLGCKLWHLALYEALMFPVVQFHHANISLPKKLDDLLAKFIVTPNMHKVHHSRKWQETNSNYTSMFSFWDRLFGTFKKREDTENISFGLEGFDVEDKQSLGGLIKTPLDKLKKQ